MEKQFCREWFSHSDYWQKAIFTSFRSTEEIAYNFFIIFTFLFVSFVSIFFFSKGLLLFETADDRLFFFFFSSNMFFISLFFCFSLIDSNFYRSKPKIKPFSPSFGCFKMELREKWKKQNKKEEIFGSTIC